MFSVRKEQPAFVVAEISANHGHDIEIVKKSISKAKEIGCDAVKIQTYTADTITLNCDKEWFQVNNGTIWDGTTLYDLYSEASLPWEWHEELFEYAHSIGIMLFSTPFDDTAVDLLEACGNPIYKIASFEITDIPLIKRAASTGKPVIISTGIATLEEIGEAVEACRSVGNDDVCLLKCTSQYPAKIEDASVATMMDMRERFQTAVGLSDHTMGSIVPVVAASLGAQVIEKHFILDRSIGGPDSSFSMDPGEFKDMIEQVRLAEMALGHTSYELTEKKRASRKYARSLFVVKDVRKGELVNRENVRSIRPSAGMKPIELEKIFGRMFAEDVERGTPMSWDLLV